ncbi:uncharacterized protein STEHIDRAFT_170353 [Stereum hirsutum FP-91666 SS1]|uniref:uncharacterized protein n=1 Tax=Stereum hirsutum (strain FP-91666) TaxID=721885 RepID=UPI000444A673|nr:uncharacterized protein STEHIDRAFT_170353 [Stereum hirsutum FP-91666 SS1]EIM83914.1 hypothetical protein STEHIDRAFT_170353 [Stereum hirsutum FP-91666 SS1]
MEDLAVTSIHSSSTGSDNDGNSSSSILLSPQFDLYLDGSPVLEEEYSDDSDEDQIFKHGCDKHPFIDRDVDPDVACVFIMAEQRRIYHALSCALYQRRAVGIHDPIIGLTFGDQDPYLWLVIGWIGKDEVNPGQTLPKVHLMHTSFDSEPSTPHGVFNMLDPLSAIHLSRVLLSVRAQFPYIKSQAIRESNSSPLDNDAQLELSWRSDQVLSDFRTEPSLNDVIAPWIETLPCRDSLTVETLDSSTDLMAPRGHKPNQNKQSKGGSGRAASSTLDAVDEDEAIDHVRSEVDVANRSAPSRFRSKKSTSSWSLSKLAARHPGDFSTPDSTSKYLLGRNVARDTKLPHEVYDTLKMDRAMDIALTKSQEYDDMVAPFWPPSWGTVKDLPQVRPEQKHLCHELLRAIKARRTCKTRVPIQDLDDEALVNLMTNRFQQLLDIVEEALVLKKSAEVINIPEAMFRSAFDRLVHLFFNGEDNQSEGRLSILEAKISMPRNTLADALLSELKDKLDMRKVVRSFTRESSIIGQHRKDISLHADFLLDFEIKNPQFGILQNNVRAAKNLLEKAVEQMEVNPKDVLSDATLEPPTGTVDNLGLVRIKDFFSPESPPKDALKSFTLFDTSRKNAKDLASHDGFVHNIQHTLGRKINVDQPNDPFASARYDYLVQDDSSHVTYDSQSPPPPNPVSSKRETTVPTKSIKQDESLDELVDLLLPLLVDEYKKDLDAFHIQGPNEVRAYLIAALKFLGVCGIENFLIASVYTEGTMGVVQGGWKDDVSGEGGKNGAVHLLDRNCQAFDIANVLGAFNFAVFLARLAHVRAPKMLELFDDDKRAALHEKLRDQESDVYKWKYSSQLAEEGFQAARQRFMNQ